MEKIGYSPSNAKLQNLESKVGGVVYSFDVVSGITCPGARECRSHVVVKAGKKSIVDGPHTKFRCFSATQEVIFDNAYQLHKRNMQVIKLAATDVVKASELLAKNLPKKAKCIRIHVSGDFKTQAYFDSWMLVAKEHPDVLFYAYTKSLPFWLKRRKELPDNFILTASRGGEHDKLIREKKLRQAVVVADTKTVDAIIASGNYDKVPVGRYKNWDIDHDDSHAALPELKKQSFALLVHSIQPAGSEAGESLKHLKKAKGKFSYTRK